MKNALQIEDNSISSFIACSQCDKTLTNLAQPAIPAFTLDDLPQSDQ